MKSGTADAGAHRRKQIIATFDDMEPEYNNGEVLNEEDLVIKKSKKKKKTKKMKVVKIEEDPEFEDELGKLPPIIESFAEPTT